MDVFIYSSTIHEVGAEDEVILWGLTETTQPVAIRVTNYTPHVYIKLPLGDDRKTYKYNEIYLNKLREEFRLYYTGGITDIEFEFKTDFYYYVMPFLYAKIYLKSIKEEELFVKFLNNNPFKIYGKEYRLESVYTRHIVGDDTKFFSSSKLKKTGWVKFHGDEVISEERITVRSKRNNLEYICRMSNIIALDRIDIPSLVVASIDIEVQSHDGTFPKSSNVNDVVYLISIALEVAGKTHKIVLSSKSSVSQEGVKIIYEEDTTKLLEKFFETILTLDPDCITGYNIIGFDFPYMIDQLSINDIRIPQAGRLKRETKIIKESWSSSASKVNKYSFPIMDGRIILDLFPIIRRNMIFPKYNLNTVAKTLLNEEKHDIEYKEMYRIYREGTLEEMGQVILYCIQDSILVLKMFNHLKIWYWVVEKSAGSYYEMGTIMYIGQQRPFISLLYVVAEENGFVLNKRHSVNFMKYEGGFVGEADPRLYRGVICLDFSSLYPSIIKAYNICPSTLLPPKLLTRDIDTTNVEVDISNVETKPVETAGNIRRNEEEVDTESDDEDKEQERKITTYRFVKATTREGLLPKLVVRLLLARKQVKDMMGKYDKSSLEYMILDKKQNSIKISNNTIYGIMGAQEGGKYSCAECSTSITAIGRGLIKRVNDIIQNVYGGVVIYNDTDSTMFTIPDLPRNQLNAKGREIAANVISLDQTIPQEMKIEFEKAMDMFLTSKKKYIGRIIGDDGNYVVKNGEIAVLKRGVASVRRDTTGLVKHIFDEVCNMIFDEKPFHEVFRRIITYIRDLYERKFGVENFIAIKQLRTGYVSESTPILVYAGYLSSIGRKVLAGDRLEYIVCVGNGRIGERMRPPDTTEFIDYDYYVGQAETALQTLMFAGFPEKRKRFINIESLTETRTKEHFTQPVLNIVAWFLRHKHFIVDKNSGTIDDVFNNLDERYNKYLEKFEHSQE